MPSAAEILAEVPIFKNLKPKELRRLEQEAHEAFFKAGTHLTDDSGIAFATSFFVVVEGSLEVLVHGQPIRKLGAGSYFGEMAVISHDDRTATVVAETDARCLVFSRWVFRPFAEEHPEVAWALLELMVERVREAEARTAVTD